MNQWKYLLGLLLLFLLSCNRAGEYEVLFRQVESVVSDHPDSAMVLLKRVEDPERLDSADWARWALLTTQARDKAFIRHTTDSVINRVADYYQRFGDNHQKALAYYYVGRVNRDLGRLEQATNAFLRAYDYSDKTNDYGLTFRILTQAGAIYARQGIINEAFDFYQRGLIIAKQGNDSSNIAFGLAYLGRIYGTQRDWEQAIANYQQAISIAEQISYMPTLKLGLKELAIIYSRIQKYQEALACLQRLLSFEKELSSKEKFAIYLNIGDLYRLSENYDSAIPYLEKALQTKNLYTKRSAYQCFYYVYTGQRNYQKAVEYNNLFWECNDSIQKIENRKAVIAVEAKYKHEKLLTEKQQLELKQSKLIFWGSSLLLVAIIIILLVYMDKKRTTIRLFEQLHAIRSQIAENKRTIASYQEQIDSLSLRQSDYDDLQQEKASLEQEVSNLLEQNEKLNSQKSQILVRLNQKDEEIKQYEEIIKQRENTPDIFTRIKQAHTIEEKEWPELIARTDALHQQFFERLRKAFPQLTETDLQLCCLMRLGYDKKEQKSLLKITDDSLEKRKQRLKRRLDPNKKWEKGELEQFIHHF